MTTIADRGRPRRRLSTTLRRVLRGALAVCLTVLALAAVLFAVVWREMSRADGELVVGGERRSYLIHVPASYDAGKPTPLVISIHGFANWPAHQALNRR